ncbi:MAG: hypothetical protein N2747_11110 [Chitinophagaceae bacterium]|nr:hypothetical protein [Chitinophagaceae bacterium]
MNRQSKSRRRFLKLVSLTGIFTAVKTSAQRIIRPVENLAISNVQDKLNYISVQLLRPEDLLALELRFYNFSLSKTFLQKKSDPAYLMVIFQPQSMLEQAWDETVSGLATPTLPGKIILSGPSRLVFKIPSSVSLLNLNKPQELLMWENLELVVNERARPAEQSTTHLDNFKPLKDLNIKFQVNEPSTLPAKKSYTKDERRIVTEQQIKLIENNRNLIPRIERVNPETAKGPVYPPGEMETSLEIPVHLYLSPTKYAGWKHNILLKSEPGILKSSNKIFELWHTRMGLLKNKTVLEDDTFHDEIILRALWADDANVKYNDNTITEESVHPQVGKTSMTNLDRHKIVHESSNFKISKFVPQPIKVRKLFLTTLGAWLDSQFTVERKKLEAAGIIGHLNVLSWRHIQTMGREHYVEVVTAGNILPFGHEAVLVKITERKPHQATNTAANFQRMLIIITEPEKFYNYKDAAGKFMNFCFASVEILNTVSPILDPVKTSFLSGSKTNTNNKEFIITSGNKEVQFKIRGKDLEGNIVDFSIPLVYISTEETGDSSKVKALVNRYGAFGAVNNTASLNGQKLALAPKDDNSIDTSFSAYNATFGMMEYQNTDEPQGFLPTLQRVEIIEPSYQRITGSAEPVAVSLVDTLDEANKGQVFAKFEETAFVNFNGNADKTGGFISPNIVLKGLSRAIGAFGGDVEKFKAAMPDASDFFKAAGFPEPKLFGIFKLSDIIKFILPGEDFYKKISLEDRLNHAGIPLFNTTELKDAYITYYALKPEVKTLTLGKIAAFQPTSSKSFVIQSQIKTWKDKSKAPEFSSFAELKDFQIGVVQLGSEYLINLKFEKVRFDITHGKKPDISVKMKDPGMAFGGPLKFVNVLNSIIPMDGFSDPPYLDVTPSGVKCGYSQAVPNLQLGAFTLANISLGAEVNLPFTGAPLTFSFRFCEKHQPFTLTYAFLGGGGYFGLELDLSGIRQIDAALEMGAAASLNFGVASGAVSVMAGIYFKMTFEDGQNSTQLTGYVRINGAVCVLGLVTASILLCMALTYLIDKNKAYGEAELKIKVEVAFFSKTVTLRTQRSFSGSGNDPNFSKCVSKEEWQEYCASFAA